MDGSDTLDDGYYDWDMDHIVPGSNFSEDMYMDHLLQNSRDSLLAYTLHQPSTIVLVTLYTPVLMTSFIGNILVIMVVVKHRKCWGITSNFLANLAAADLLVSTMCLPLTIAQIVYVPWPYGTVMCKITNYAQGVAVTASTFTLTSMSLDRCLAIRYPIKFRSIRTSRNIRRLLGIVWISSLCLMAPLAVYKSTTQHPVFTDIHYCVETWPSVTSRQTYDLSLLILLYIIPGVVVVVSYGVMGRRLWVTDKSLKVSVTSKSVSTKHGCNNNRSEAMLRGRRSFAKMLIAVSILFALSWLPYYVMTTYMDFTPPQNQSFHILTLSSLSLFFGHSNSATNPIIYCLMNKAFRRYLASMVRCRKLATSETRLFVSGKSSFHRSFTTRLKSTRSKTPPSTSAMQMTSLGKVGDVETVCVKNGSFARSTRSDSEECKVAYSRVTSSDGNQNL